MQPKFDFRLLLLRRYARFDRDAIEGLAGEAVSVEWFDAAIASFVTAREQYYPQGPRTEALRRLARRYARHHRDELLRLHQLAEMATRQALMGAS